MDKERKADAGTKATHGFPDMPTVGWPIHNITGPPFDNGGLGAITLKITGVIEMFSVAKIRVWPKPHPLPAFNHKFEISGVSAMKTGRSALIVAEESSGLRAFLRKIDLKRERAHELTQPQPDPRGVRLNIFRNQGKPATAYLPGNIPGLTGHRAIARTGKIFSDVRHLLGMLDEKNGFASFSCRSEIDRSR